jgi:CDP-4-dehydro-6-deoxyglucose reductase
LPRIILSNGVEFECSSEQSILDAAKQNKITIEHSCSTGRCGVCAAPLVSGRTKLIKEGTIAENEVKQGDIITCCRAPVTDIYLGIEDLSDIGIIPAVTLPCRISGLNLLNDDVMQVILRTPPNSDFNFVAGQYLDLIYRGIRRSYSIGNKRRDDGKLYLNIKKVKGGEMSDYLFHHAELNHLLRFEGPLGTFSFREDLSKNIVLLATGTGIAPVKAILEYLEEMNFDRNIFVIWGGRYLKDLYWNPNCLSLPLTYIPVLSRQTDWDGAKGYVQDALLALGLDFTSTTIYACGSEIMIKESLKLLLDNGLPRNRYYCDAFVSSN